VAIVHLLGIVERPDGAADCLRGHRTEQGMNGDYGQGLLAFSGASLALIWIGVGLLTAAVGLAIWLAVRAER
jgi:hypothetical protein